MLNPHKRILPCNRYSNLFLAIDFKCQAFSTHMRASQLQEEIVGGVSVLIQSQTCSSPKRELLTSFLSRLGRVGADKSGPRVFEFG